MIFRFKEVGDRPWVVRGLNLAVYSRRAMKAPDTIPFRVANLIRDC